MAQAESSAWLEMAVEEEDGKGGKRRTNRARRERKGTSRVANLPIAYFTEGYTRRTARADTSRKRHPRSTAATVAPATTANIRPGAPISRVTASQ